MPPESAGMPLADELPISLAMLSPASPIRKVDPFLTVRLRIIIDPFFDGTHTSVFADRPSPTMRFPNRKPDEFRRESVDPPVIFTVPSFMFKPALPLEVVLLEEVE